MTFSTWRPAHAARKPYTLHSSTTRLAVELLEDRMVLTGASNTSTVLILSTSVRNGLSSMEAVGAIAAGMTVELATPAQWASKSAADFATYRSLILGDIDTSNITTAIGAAVANKSVWGPVVAGATGGNIFMVGSDTSSHRPVKLVNDGVAWTVGGGVGTTGFYFCLSNYYGTAAARTPVPLLDIFGVGTFTARGSGCSSNAHVVATTPSGPLSTLVDSDINISCVHEAFDSWEPSFQVLGIDRSAAATYTATDGSRGSPYILARGAGIEVISAITISPLTATPPAGGTQTLTANAYTDVTRTVNAADGTVVTFTVVAGPNVGITGTAITTGGVATFNYADTGGAGIDVVRATFVDTLSNVQTSTNALITWGASPAGITVTPSGGATDVTEGGATDTFTVVLLSAPTANVVLSPGANTQVSAPLVTFTPADWNVPQTIVIAAVDDALVEGPHTSALTYTSASTDNNYLNLVQTINTSISDNDQAVVVAQTGASTTVVEGGITDTYTIVLNAQPTADVTIALSAGTQVTVSSPVLTFTSITWSTPQTVTVTAVSDGASEGIHTGTITHTVTSADPGYNGKTVSPITANINDPPGLLVSSTALSISEAGQTGTYTVQLASQPSANVIVTLGNGSQVRLSASTLVFQPANWNVPQTVTVTAVDDIIAEGPQSATITNTAASADTGYSGLTRGVTAAITDNDNPNVLISGGQLTLLEGVSKSYTAVLNSEPVADVVLNLTGNGQVSLVSAVTFTPADWNTPRPVFINAVDDGLVEGNHLGIFTPAVTSADPLYNFSMPTITANIIDNDGAANFGTAGNDLISVTFAAGKTTLIMNGKSTVLPSTLAVLNLFTGTGNDTIQITNPTIPIVVSGGNGTDKVIVTGQTAANVFVLDSSSVQVNGVAVSAWDVENVTVSGRAGNDTFSILATPTYTVDLKGDAGTDLITGPAQDNTWSITGTTLGKLNNVININGIENWTGGTGNDQFAFAAGKVLGGTIDGGAGTNTFDWSLYTSAVSANLQTGVANGVKNFTNINRFVGGKGAADKLIGRDQINTWNLSTMNGGTLNGAAFLYMENLTGGSLADTFVIADGAGVKGKIDGGAGVDLLDYTPYLSKPITINLQTKTATYTAGFFNLEQFQGGSGLNDVLIGFNKLNTWNVTGSGAGDINATTLFGNFENLTGGTSADTFILQDAFAEWQGTLNGGTGTDTLKAFAGASNIWVGQIDGTLNGRKFTSIEKRV